MKVRDVEEECFSLLIIRELFSFYYFMCEHTTLSNKYKSQMNSRRNVNITFRLIYILIYISFLESNKSHLLVVFSNLGGHTVSGLDDKNWSKSNYKIVIGCFLCLAAPSTSYALLRTQTWARISLSQGRDETEFHPTTEKDKLINVEFMHSS